MKCVNPCKINVPMMEKPVISVAVQMKDIDFRQCSTMEKPVQISQLVSV